MIAPSAPSAASAPSSPPAVPIGGDELDALDRPVAKSAVTPPASTLAPTIARLPRRRGPFARIAGIGGYGILPRADFGFQLAVGGLRPRLRLEGALNYLPGQTATLPDGRGGTQGFAAVDLRACPRFLGSPVELSLCGALEIGASWSRSIGLDPPHRAAGPWVALSLGAALDWWFSPQVALHTGVEGLAAPVSTTFAIGPDGLAGGRHFGVRGVLGLAFSLAQQKSGQPEK